MRVVALGFGLALGIGLGLALGEADTRATGRNPYSLPPPGERDRLKITYSKEEGGGRRVTWELLASGKLESTIEGTGDTVRRTTRLVSEVDVRQTLRAFQRAEFLSRKRVAGHPDDRPAEFMRFDLDGESYTVTRKNDHLGGYFDRLVGMLRRLTEPALAEREQQVIDALDEARRDAAKVEAARQAIRSLAEVSSVAGVPSLVSALRVAALKDAAAEAIGRSGDRRAAGSLLAEWKTSPSVAVAVALGLAGDKAALKPLHKCIRGTSAPELRAACAVAAGELRYPKVAPALLYALRDESPEVRAHSAEALGRLRDHRVVEPLIELLTDQDVNVVVEVVQALGVLRDPAAREPLKKVAERVPAVAKLVEDALSRLRQ